MRDLNDKKLKNPLDCEYIGFCQKRKKFIVHEQLYPESRGYLVHQFDTEEDARIALGEYFPAKN